MPAWGQYGRWTALCLLVLLYAVCAPGCCAQDASSGNPYADAMGLAESDLNSADSAGAVLEYLDAVSLAPSTADAAAARSALFAMIAAHGMPHRLTAGQIAQIKARNLLISVQDEPRGVELLGLSGADGDSLDAVADPQYNWPYPAILGVYQPDSNAPGPLVLDCNIHYQTMDDAQFAVNTGRLLALLRQVLEEKTGETPNFDGAFDVWLSRSESSTPGGEEWRNNVYLYNIGDDRSSIEWIREIAHEYSHLAFPPLGGNYTSPEAWANGYSGERLLVRWLSDPQVAGRAAVESAWGRTFAGYVNFKAKLIDPPLSLFESIGLSHSWLAKRDELGMKYVIGLLLWVDDKKGSDAVGNLLWEMPSPDPSTLYEPCKQLGVPLSMNRIPHKGQHP